MDIFGNTDPRKMPSYLFGGARDVNYQSSVRADVSKQNYRVCPRHWYIDATYVCNDCKGRFVWSAAEQRMWFENYGHYVDSEPKCCKSCYARRRQYKVLFAEYSEVVPQALEKGAIKEKAQVLEILEKMEKLRFKLTKKMMERREIFSKQLDKNGQ